MVEALVLQCHWYNIQLLAACKFSTVERKDREGDCKGGQFWPCTPYNYIQHGNVFCNVMLDWCVWIDTACCKISRFVRLHALYSTVESREEGSREYQKDVIGPACIPYLMFPQTHACTLSILDFGLQLWRKIKAARQNPEQKVWVWGYIISTVVNCNKINYRQ